MGGESKSASAEPEPSKHGFFSFSSLSPKCVHACTYNVQTGRRSSAGACVIACAKMVMEACARFPGCLFGHSYCSLYMQASDVDNLLTVRGQSCFESTSCPYLYLSISLSAPYLFAFICLYLTSLSPSHISSHLHPNAGWPPIQDTCNSLGAFLKSKQPPTAAKFN